MTSPGSDVFNPGLGGNLQNWVGGRNPLDNPQALVTKTVLLIVNTAAQFTAQQLGKHTNQRENQQGPSSWCWVLVQMTQPKMTVSLKLIMANQDNILFGLGLDSLDTLVGSAG